jgi:multicomponent Na+:H+ antiporter subunit G
VIGELVALLGAALVLLAAVGVNRFDDTLARLHALAKASTLGLLLLLGGVAVNVRDVDHLTSVVLAALLHLLASPPASNMVSRAAYLHDAPPTGVLDERRGTEAGAAPDA